MIHNVPKPTISAEFSVADIRKIRDWHYEILKDATRAERTIFYAEGVERLFEGREHPKTVRPS